MEHFTSWRTRSMPTELSGSSPTKSQKEKKRKKNSNYANTTSPTLSPPTNTRPSTTLAFKQIISLPPHLPSDFSTEKSFTALPFPTLKDLILIRQEFPTHFRSNSVTFRLITFFLLSELSNSQPMKQTRAACQIVL